MGRSRTDGCSIHQVIRYTVLGCFLLCALVSFGVMKSLSNAYDSEFSEHQGKVQEQCFAQVKNCLNEAEWLSRHMIASEPLQQALKTISQSDGKALANAQVMLHSAISFAAGDVDNYMRNIIVMDVHGRIYSYGNILNKALLLKKTKELLNQTPTDGTVAWHGLVSEGMEYMVLTRAIRESKRLSLELIGYEAICVDVRSMLGRIEMVPYTMLDQTEIYMDGLRLYRGEACPDVGTPMALKSRQIISWNGNDYFVTRMSFFDGRVEMVDYTDYGRILKSLNRGRAMCLLMMGLAFLVLIVISLRLIDGIFRRMDRLTDAIEHVDEDNLRLTLDKDLLDSQDEVGILARYLQKLMEQIDALVNQRLKRRLYAVQAQNRMLQAQIHPHFLYNTLETIHALAAQSGNDAISRITISLSRLVRASFRGSSYVTLNEEISFVQEYLTIYRIRFGQRLNAMIDYDEEDGEKILLPQMTLQPLVENSVRYGLMRKQSRGVIRLKIRRRNGRLCISLFDNGTGFPQEMIERYEHASWTEELEIHGYGNVLCRLRFTYGDAATVKVRSREGRWTNLSISIPESVPEWLLQEKGRTDV